MVYQVGWCSSMQAQHTHIHHIMTFFTNSFHSSRHMSRLYAVQATVLPSTTFQYFVIQSSCQWHYTDTATNSMAQTPISEANSCSAIQEIPYFLENKGSSLSSHEVSSKSDKSSSTTPTYFLHIQLNIIPPTMPRSCKWSLSLRFSHPTFLLAHECHMASPS